MEVTIPVSLPDAQLVFRSLQQWAPAARPACWVRVSCPDRVATFAGGPVDWVTLAQYQGHGQMQAHKKQLIIDMYRHSTPLQRIYN